MEDVLEDNFNFTLSEDVNGPLISAFVAVIMTTALFANLFVITVTFYNSKSWKHSSTIFLKSLLFADIVVTLQMPFSVISGANGGWIFGESVEKKNGVL